MIDKLDTFTRSYLQSILWAETDGDEPLDKNYSIEDFAPGTVESAIADCRKFQDQNRQLWDGIGPGSDGSPPDARAGHDFWLTRAGHGVGFWDRPEVYGEENAEKLTEAAKQYREVIPTVGDNGKIYLEQNT